MFHIILYQPEIPPNTGNIIRLCANMGAQLHLIHPMGFVFDDKRLRRAGLDYHEFANITHHQSYEAFMENLPCKRLFALTTKGATCYSSIDFEPGDGFMFGPESRGLPAPVLEQFEPSHRVKLPQKPGSRSLNLSNCVAIVAYDAWRQQGFG